MATNALYLVCDMINDLVHADGPSKKSYGGELARRKIDFEVTGPTRHKLHNTLRGFEVLPMRFTQV